MTISTVYLPKTNFNNKGIKWAPDNQSAKGEVQTMQTINLENDVEELIDNIGLLTWVSGIEVWKITEEYLDKDASETKGYLLRGLEMELEQGAIIAVDMDEILLLGDNNYVLGAFLQESVSSILKLDNYTFKIIFKTGSITIQGLAE